MNKSNYIFLIFSFIIIILVLSVWFFFWHDVDIMVKHKATAEGQILVKVYKDPLLTNPKHTVRRIFQAPFDLSFYELCFKNRSRVEKPGNVEYLGVTYTLKEANGKPINLEEMRIEAGDRTCFYLNVDSFFIVQGKMDSFDMIFGPPVEVHFDLVPDEKANPIFYDKVASSVIFMISVLGLLSILNSVIKLSINLGHKWKVFRAKKIISKICKN